MKIVISSGHGKYIRGAEGLIDEVDQARKVVPKVREFLLAAGHDCIEYHDDFSTTQNENLQRIVAYHDKQTRDLDVSVHFNAYVPTDGGRGVEVLYLTQDQLAKDVAAAISRAGGLINRGAHKRTDLYFLNKTDEPSILIEVCFVDAATDVEQYQNNFDEICEAIANAIAPDLHESVEYPPVQLTGKVSWFGGPTDEGVDADEPLAFIHDEDDTDGDIFLEEQPPGTTGLARKLNSEGSYYVACRWDYDQTPHDMLLTKQALVSARGKSIRCWPADWGPHTSTSRVADVSIATLNFLGLHTDDTVTVIFPAPEDEEV
jgi:N-acetylmuramoyl-L-alanine amidase